MIATTDAYLELRPIAYHLKQWLKGRGWSIQTLKEGPSHRFRANRSNFDSDSLANQCFLEVECFHESDKTKVMVKSYGWDEDLRNNWGWVILTGGTDISRAHRPLVVRKQFYDYVEQVLKEATAQKDTAPGG